MKTIKIRIKPNISQKKLFNDHFGAHRFIYNKCVEFVSTTDDFSIFNHKDCKECGTCAYCLKDKTRLNVNKLKLRPHVILKNSEIKKLEKDTFLLDIYYDSRDGALESFVANWNALY